MESRSVSWRPKNLARYDNLHGIVARIHGLWYPRPFTLKTTCKCCKMQEVFCLYFNIFTSITYPLFHSMAAFLSNMPKNPAFSPLLYHIYWRMKTWPLFHSMAAFLSSMPKKTYLFATSVPHILEHENITSSLPHKYLETFLPQKYYIYFSCCHAVVQAKCLGGQPCKIYNVISGFLLEKEFLISLS